MFSSITDFWRVHKAVCAVFRAIKQYDDGKILTCHCGDCPRLQTQRTTTPGIGYCDNHAPVEPTYKPPHVQELREFNSLIYP